MNDDYTLTLFVAGSLLLALFAFFLIAFLLVQKNKQNKYQIEKESINYRHQNEILRIRLEEQEQSTNQISKEIHDNVGQLLSLVRMNMYRIEGIAMAEAETKIVTNTSSLLDKAIYDLHNISHSLNSDYIKKTGFVPAIRKELDYVITANSTLVCNLEIIGDPVSLGYDRELVIYRIVQEALHNIIKHAKATVIDLVLEYESAKFNLKIIDNGVGFDKNKIYSTQGIGFMNMYQRAKFLEGELIVHSEINKGSSIHLSLEL